MFDSKLKKIAKYLLKNNMTAATAESCTGGLLSSRFTDISGSSGFIRANFVTYSNEAKEKFLLIPHEILEKYGAVSSECAYAMADGLQKLTKCNLAVCTTGIAGPTGGTREKPVGLMYVSVYFKGNIEVKEVLLNPFIPRKLMKFLFTQRAVEFAAKVIAL